MHRLGTSRFGIITMLVACVFHNTAMLICNLLALTSLIFVCQISSVPASSAGLPGWAVATLVILLLLLLFVIFAGATMMILVLLRRQKGEKKSVTGNCSNHYMK